MSDAVSEPLRGIRLTGPEEALRSPFDAPIKKGRILIRERFVRDAGEAGQLGYGHWLWCSLEVGMLVRVRVWPKSYLGGGPRWAAAYEYRWRVEKINRVTVKLIHDGPNVLDGSGYLRPSVVSCRPCYLEKVEETDAERKAAPDGCGRGARKNPGARHP